MENISNAISFVENPMYEQLISDLGTQQYSICDDFFSAETVSLLRQSLLNKHEENRFKKAAIGNRVNEVIVKSIRGDQILWIDENLSNTAEALFFDQINDLVQYLNRTCFFRNFA